LCLGSDGSVHSQTAASLVSRSRRRVPTWQRQSHQLDRRIVVGKMPAGLDDLAQLRVDTLERVGRVDHPPDVGPPLPQFANRGCGESDGRCRSGAWSREDRSQRFTHALEAVGDGDRVSWQPRLFRWNRRRRRFRLRRFGFAGHEHSSCYAPHKIPDRLCKTAARSALHPRLATIKRAAPFNLRLICVLSALYLRPVFICVLSAFYLRYLRLIFGCLYLRSPPRRLGAWRARHRARRD
jgi:hypothetical protein